MGKKITSLWGRYCWKFLVGESSEWKEYTLRCSEGEGWNQASGARAGKLAQVHKESGPEFWYPLSLSIDMFLFIYIYFLIGFLNCTRCWMGKPQLSVLISIWVKQPRVHRKVIWTIWTCWDVRKAGNLMKTGFLLKFLALPFLVLFGETPRVQFLPIFHFGMSGLSQITEASKEQWEWKIKTMISSLRNSGGNNSPHGLKASSKGVRVPHFFHIGSVSLKTFIIATGIFWSSDKYHPIYAFITWTKHYA